MAEAQASSIRKSENFVYKKDDIKEIKFEDFINPWSFPNVLMSEDMKLVKWLMNRNLLAEHMKCANCEQDYRLGERGKNLDGVTWRCVANRSHETYVRKFSFFSKSHLRLPDCFQFTLCFFTGAISQEMCH